MKNEVKITHLRGWWHVAYSTCTITFKNTNEHTKQNARNRIVAAYFTYIFVFYLTTFLSALGNMVLNKMMI
jgi:hypothetical protein